MAPKSSQAARRAAAKAKAVPPSRPASKGLGKGQTAGGADTIPTDQMAHHMATMHRLSAWGLYPDVFDLACARLAQLRALVERAPFEEAVRTVLGQTAEESPDEFEHIREVAVASWPCSPGDEDEPLHPFDESRVLLALPHDVRRAVATLAGKYVGRGHLERQALQHALVEAMDYFPEAFAVAGAALRSRGQGGDGPLDAETVADGGGRNAAVFWFVNQTGGEAPLAATGKGKGRGKGTDARLIAVVGMRLSPFVDEGARMAMDLLENSPDEFYRIADEASGAQAPSDKGTGKGFSAFSGLGHRLGE